MLKQTHKCYALAGDNLGQIAYDLYGSTDATNAILCLHGTGLNRSMFHDLTNSLSDQYKILCPDMIGHGGSYWAEKSYYNIDKYCDDTVSIVNTFAFKQMICIGNGIGSMIALKLASLVNSPITGVVVDLVPGQIDAELFKKHHEKATFHSILTSISNKEFEEMDYIKYMINNFNITIDGVTPVFDYQGYSGITDLDAHLDILKEISVPCPVMIIARKGSVKGLHKSANANLNIYETACNYRVKYTMEEVERIATWIQVHTLKEEERIQNLLGINSGNSRDITRLA